MSHPNIVQVFDVIEAEGLPWTVMEFVDGLTLRALLARQEALAIDDVVRYAEGLVDALRMAHDRGILHRDIKPSNVIVDREGRARLKDFGLAKVCDDGARPGPTTLSVDETHSGVVVGTPGDLSLEQALGRPVDRRSDILALGTVLYEMCTGRPAFASSSRWDSFDAVLHREPAAIATLNYEVPQELERIVRKCLAKSPDERYQDCRDLLADLRALRRRRETPVLPPRPGPGPRSVRGGLARWWPERADAIGVRAGLVAAAIVGVVVVAWVIDHLPEGGPPSILESAPRQVTSAPGWEAGPAISPDGSLIAYTSGESGNPDVWLTDVRGG